MGDGFFKCSIYSAVMLVYICGYAYMCYNLFVVVFLARSTYGRCFFVVYTCWWDDVCTEDCFLSGALPSKSA